MMRRDWLVWACQVLVAFIIGLALGAAWLSETHYVDVDGHYECRTVNVATYYDCTLVP